MSLLVRYTHPNTNKVVDVMDKPPKFNGTTLQCIHVR